MWFSCFLLNCILSINNNNFNGSWHLVQRKYWCLTDIIQKRKMVLKKRMTSMGACITHLSIGVSSMKRHSLASSLSSSLPKSLLWSCNRRETHTRMFSIGPPEKEIDLKKRKSGEMCKKYLNLPVFSYPSQRGGSAWTWCWPGREGTALAGTGTVL